MSDLGAFLLLNTLAATALAVVVAFSGRFLRRPALVHGLWLLVLIKLFTPPLLEVAVLPTSAIPEPVAESRPTAPLPPTVPLVVVAERESATGTTPLVARRPTAPLGLAVWAIGAVIVLALAILRACRFNRLLRHAREAPEEVRRRTEQLAALMGLRGAPEVRVVPARISPMLWFRPGSLQLLLPERLLGSLEPGERDALLAHELAHVRRRDHWVRYLELLASTIFWWHPLVWWARRQLRRVEEQCCDAWVVRVLSGHPRIYASALLKTLEFLTGSRIATPALACGATETGPLKERLTMIMRRRTPKMPSRIQIAALALVAVPALLFFPTWADRETPASGAAKATEEADLRRSLLALERKAVQLEEQLQIVRAEQMALEQEFQERVEVHELDRTRAEAERAEAAGQAERAREVYERAVRLERRIELERRDRDLERDRVRGMRELETPLRQLHLEIEEAEVEGNHSRAEELRVRAEDLAYELERRSMKMQQAQEQYQEAMIHEQLEEMREEIARQELEGQAEEARQLAMQMDELRMQLDLMRAEQGEDETLQRQIEIELLERRIRELDNADPQEEIRDLQERIRALTDELDRAQTR